MYVAVSDFATLRDVYHGMTSGTVALRGIVKCFCIPRRCNDAARAFRQNKSQAVYATRLCHCSHGGSSTVGFAMCLVNGKRLDMMRIVQEAPTVRPRCARAVPELYMRYRDLAGHYNVTADVCVGEIYHKSYMLYGMHEAYRHGLYCSASSKVYRLILAS